MELEAKMVEWQKNRMTEGQDRHLQQEYKVAEEYKEKSMAEG
jgi:hypothetical protein